jgi:small subunit ribosomal protein S18
MPRGGDRDRSKRSPKDAGRRTKKKVCLFCKDKIDWVDYKDVNLLRKFMSDRGKIRARRVSGNCAQHQRDVAVAIKTARELALLPYSQRTMTERSGRGGRGAPRPVVPRVEPDVAAPAPPAGPPDGAAEVPLAAQPPAPAEPERPAAPVGADAAGGGDQ